MGLIFSNHIGQMLDEILEIEHYDKLMDNEMVMKCKLCDYRTLTIGAMNHHIGMIHLGKTPLIKRKEKKVDGK